VTDEEGRARYYDTGLDDLPQGLRVQLHPATDLWMAGACYGTVVATGRKYATVKLDRLTRPRRIAPYLLRAI
jgi:hypothetical protein